MKLLSDLERRNFLPDFIESNKITCRFHYQSWKKQASLLLHRNALFFSTNNTDRLEFLYDFDLNGFVKKTLNFLYEPETEYLAFKTYLDLESRNTFHYYKYLERFANCSKNISSKIKSEMRYFVGCCRNMRLPPLNVCANHFGFFVFPNNVHVMIMETSARVSKNNHIIMESFLNHKVLECMETIINHKFYKVKIKEKINCV